MLLSGESKKTLSLVPNIITSRTKALTSLTRKEGPKPRLKTWRFFPDYVSMGMTWRCNGVMTMYARCPATRFDGFPPDASFERMLHSSCCFIRGNSQTVSAVTTFQGGGHRTQATASVGNDDLRESVQAAQMHVREGSIDTEQRDSDVRGTVDSGLIRVTERFLCGHGKQRSFEGTTPKRALMILKADRPLAKLPNYTTRVIQQPLTARIPLLGTDQRRDSTRNALNQFNTRP